MFFNHHLAATPSYHHHCCHFIVIAFSEQYGIGIGYETGALHGDSTEFSQLSA